MPDTCEILIAIVHLARGLTLISSPALILHRKWLPFPGDCQLIFTGLENSYCRSNTSSSSTPQVTCLEVQTRGPNSCTLLILDVQPGCNVTWSRHSNVARPAAPSCWWGIYKIIARDTWIIECVLKEPRARTERIVIMWYGPSFFIFFSEIRLIFITL